LRYGDENTNLAFELKEAELNFLKGLLNEEHCVEMSHGYIVGGLATITEGSMVGYEGYIKKVNRHKREAILEFELMGSTREITVGLNIIKRIS
jgi:transcriptional antiterminator NusG